MMHAREIIPACRSGRRNRLPQLRQRVVLLILAILLPMFCAAATITAQVEQPRAFGHTVGDVLVQRVALGTAGAPFAAAELPRIGRVGASLWRRRSEEQIDAAGRHWLVLEYQLINTPQSLSVWYLPTLKLKARAGVDQLVVPATPFSITPFTPPQPFEQAALPAVQPDEMPASIPLAPIERRMKIAAATLLATALVWGCLAGWRYLRRGRHLPFARALRDLRRLHGKSTQAQSPHADPLAAQRRLHHALNDAAGEVVRPASLDKLLARAPHLVAERAALARFLQESQAVFFGGQAAPDREAIDGLARRLHRLERRHVA